MHPRERILEMGKLCLERGEPIPLDLLAEASELGLSLSDFDEPTFTETQEGDDNYGINIKETDIHDL
jgi:hypothetical protein